MNQTLNQIIVIARRDFMAVVATPTFLLFLLAPFFMLGISVASGFGGAYLAKGALAGNDPARIALCRYFAENMLNETGPLNDKVITGADSLLDAAGLVLGMN